MLSVIMPVYNGASHLEEAIDSILGQTFTDFEFLIINDGSSDGSEEIIKSYDDNRIKYINNGRNLGIVKTLNKGIELATRKYIARMDADDISLPHRFEKQIAFMEANPEIAASGSNIIRFYNDDINQTNPSKVKLLNKDLKIRTLFYTAFWHPTMMLRTQVLIGHNLRYNSDYKYTQDKALWIDISNNGSVANLEEPLLYYRVHKNQVSTKHFDEQYDIGMAITRKALENLGVDVSPFSNDIIRYISYPQKCLDIADLYSVEILMKEVVKGLSANPNFDSDAVISFLKSQIKKTLEKSNNIGLPLISYIYKSEFVDIRDFDIRFFVKSVLKRNTKSVNSI